MSLSVDGVWKSGVWATTVWADGVWYEGSPAADNCVWATGVWATGVWQDCVWWCDTCAAPAPAEETYSGGYEEKDGLLRILPYKRFEIETEEDLKAFQVLEEIVAKAETPAEIKPVEMELEFRLRMIEMQIEFEAIYQQWLEALIERRRQYLEAIFLLLQ